MIIKSVTAGNFGMLKGATLDFTEGMNIISGPNESAKSTWHAAIVTSICGLRRGRGVRREETEFKKRYSPWNSTSWDVSAEVLTDFGDTLNVSQDLANLVSSQVLKLGRNITAEFEIEGSPDLSTLVGLRRDIFGSTASIRQAEIRLSAENAQGLQEAIQSAISTAGSGSPAAGAIVAIANYKQQHVGIARANAVKPLQLAIQARETAENKLRAAEDEHYNYLAQLEKVENLDRKVKSVSDAISAAEMEIKAQEIRTLESEINLISEEIEKFGASKPDEAAERSDLDQDVTQAIADWNTKSNITNLPSPSSEEIAAELLLIVDPEFNANPNLDQCRNEELRKLVRDFERLVMDLNTLKGQYALLDNQSALWAAEPRVEPILKPVGTLDAGQKNSRKIMFLGGAVLSAAISIAAIAINQLILSVSLGVSALVMTFLAIRKGAVEGQVQIPVDNFASKSYANPFSAVITSSETEINKKNSEIREANAKISNALLSLGFPTNDDDFYAALAQYIFKTQCDDVFEKRVDVEARLERTKETEHRIVKGRAHNVEVLANLRGVSIKCGIENSETISEDALISQLKAWLSERDDQRVLLSNAKASWVKRETILKGRTLVEMQEELEKLRAGSDNRLWTTQDGASREELMELLRQLREDESTAANTAASARGQLKALTMSNLSVTDCEQELQEANAELERVENLARILDKTSEFLEAAQTKVHRDIAPILEVAICAQLPTITGGRYTRAKVDPEDLSVKIDVSNGRFEDANLLSYGTTEQIYLLLRIALIDHLTNGKESCPIICDDITVHADSERTIGILKLLKEISQKRQVIMFSQEAEVLAWGKKNLTGSREQVKTL